MKISQNSLKRGRIVKRVKLLRLKPQETRFKMKSNKLPGSGGFSSDFLRSFGSIMVLLLLDVLIMDIQITVCP